MPRRILKNSSLTCFRLWLHRNIATDCARDHLLTPRNRPGKIRSPVHRPSCVLQCTSRIPSPSRSNAQVPAVAALVVDDRRAMAAVDAQAVVGAATGATQPVGEQQVDEVVVARLFIHQFDRGEVHRHAPRSSRIIGSMRGSAPRENHRPDRSSRGRAPARPLEPYPFLPVPPPGTEGDVDRHGAAATAPRNRPVSSPTGSWGETALERTTAGSEATRRRATDRRAA